MSLVETKAHLIELLGDPENRVIALSGKWGTGKTHLWGEITAETSDERVQGALYVSLFGLSSIDQIKRKLIEAVAPCVEAHPSLWETSKKAVTAGLKVLEGFHQGFAALNELNLLMLAPVMLRQKVIVIDDIERRHENLGIDEVLGFIDEFTQRHDVRFVLILNSDQLAEREAWDTLREKVIDQEIRLTTTPDEAFSIAIRMTPSRYAEAIEKAAVICRLTNIRIVGKVIRAANRILADRELGEAILARVVPSIVLFSAIHYKGIEDGPDVQFALNIATPDWEDYARDRNQEPTEEQKRSDGWRVLMQELGILGCDEFEALVVEYLESGLFDAGKLNPIIERYIAEQQNFEVREQANQFLLKAYWDHRVSEAQLIDEASQLLRHVTLLDAFMVTELSTALAELDDDAGIGQAIVNAWIVNFRAQQHEHVDDDNPFGRKLHPAIQAEFDSINKDTHANGTVLEACLHIIDRRGWGTIQEVVMKRATAADFEAAIRNAEVGDMRRLLRRMLEMRSQWATYERHFGSAGDRFVEACRAIANDPESPRLAGIVKRVFNGTELASELEPEPEAAAPVPLQEATAADSKLE